MILALAIGGWLVSSALLGWSLIVANHRVRDARRAAEHPAVYFTLTREGGTWQQTQVPYDGNADPVGWDNVGGPDLRLVDNA